MSLLFLFYKVLGVLLLVLTAAMLAEKYRIVHGAVLCDARILGCEKAANVSGRHGSGGYCYLVELYVKGERLQKHTNDAFWFNHSHSTGQVVTVWYNDAEKLVERKSFGTELLALGLAAVGVALLLIQ